MTTPLWKYPGTLNGRIEASHTLLTSVLSSYYYGRTGDYYSYYGDFDTDGDYEYDYFYYEGYGYYTGHVFCLGEDTLPLPDYRFAVGDYASLTQDLIDDLHSISYVEYRCELRLSEDQPQAARRLVTSGAVEFRDSSSLADYPFGNDTTGTLVPAYMPIIVLPADAADLFEAADVERLVQITGGANAGVYRISAVPWSFGNCVSAPGTGDLLNGRIAVIEFVGGGGTWSAEGSIASVTVEMVGLRWVARAYYDGTERNYLEEVDPGGHSWARTMHVHCSKAATGTLRTLKHEVLLEAVDSSFATVAAAAGLSCRVPAPALYLDELVRTTVTSELVLLNRVPQDNETGVPAASCVRLHVVSLTTGATLSSTVKVYITRSTDALRTLAYDQAAGGFQTGYTGTRSAATLQASPDATGNDELDLVIDPVTDFTSLETVLVEVEGGNSAGNLLADSYSFTVEDLTAPELEAVLWLTPRKCRVKFNEATDTSTSPGGSLFIIAATSGVIIESTSEITLPGTTPSAAWVGYWVSIAGSYPGNAGPFEITAVNTVTRKITLNTTSLQADDGIDTNDSDIVVRERDIQASVSPFYLAARLSTEGSTYDAASAERIQCTFLPIPLALGAVTTAELPAGEDPDQYVYVTWSDDISINRLYTLHGTKIEDAYDNAMSDSTLDFTAPSFGAPADRLTLWSDGIIAGSDRKQDIESGDHYLRKLAVILQDLLNVLWYRVDEIQYLDDPARCHVDWVEFMLYELGNPFRFPLDTETLKRKLANALPGFYKKVGTEKGIAAMLYLLLGIEFEIDAYSSGDYWRLGFSELGIESVLGPGTAWARNAYEVVAPVDLTAAQRRMVTDVCVWADPSPMHLVRIVEPSTGSAVTSQYWILGQSALGLTTTLAG